MQDTRGLIVRSATDFPAIRRAGLEILQVNLGYRCNLSCVHCHVNAGPNRTETMADEDVELLLTVLEHSGVKVLDVTGGAPEMHPRFRELVRRARAMDVEVIDRCNLTILLEPGFEEMAGFLAEQQVHVVASLPCYLEENVEKQRGKGVYSDSIRAIRMLNELGYGSPDTGLLLDLVYNPVGAHLPPDQASLEQDYKRELAARFDIHFNSLFTITNMPISRFGAVLLAQGQYNDYMQLLKDNHSNANLAGVMCRSTVSVDYRGLLYDCDFNQMLDLPIQAAGRQRHLRDLLEWDCQGEPIRVADHCFGCTAGAGSSCGGALSD